MSKTGVVMETRNLQQLRLYHRLKEDILIPKRFGTVVNEVSYSDITPKIYALSTHLNRVFLLLNKKQKNLDIRPGLQLDIIPDSFKQIYIGSTSSDFIIYTRNLIENYFMVYFGELYTFDIDFFNEALKRELYKKPFSEIDLTECYQ